MSIAEAMERKKPKGKKAREPPRLASPVGSNHKGFSLASLVEFCSMQLPRAKDGRSNRVRATFAPGLGGVSQNPAAGGQL